MPRKARVKTGDAIFHIMCKSISEIILFKDDEDKGKYLSLIKKYKDLYKCKIYGYCLMDNHSHILIDANGADISKVMHGINFSYAMYFNRKYEREGHLFKDRFKSKIVDNDLYLKTLSLYMHNNPTNISRYKNCPEKYGFSSLGIFLGKRVDSFKLVDYGFIMSLFGESLKKARKNYFDLIFKSNEERLKEGMEFEDEETEYKSGRKLLVREFRAEDVVEFVGTRMNIHKTKFYMKYSRNLVEAKALVVVMLRSLCNFKSSDICSLLGNITQARVSKLSTIGIELIGIRKEHTDIVEDFIKSYAVSV